MSEPLVTQEHLADAAFDLLTSSGIERYVRMAKRAAIRAELRERALRDEIDAVQMFTRSVELWSGLALLSSRGESETELAILITALSTVGPKELVDVLLMALAIEQRPSLAWIAALARKLRSERLVTVDSAVSAPVGACYAPRVIAVCVTANSSSPAGPRTSSFGEDLTIACDARDEPHHIPMAA